MGIEREPLSQEVGKKEKSAKGETLEPSVVIGSGYAFGLMMTTNG